DREYVVLLSDWSFETPERIFAKLKKQSDNYNFQQRTVFDFFRDTREQGLAATLAERRMWGEMRMSPTDIADITGATYTFLVNGHAPEENWTGLFQPGERVRLRFINAAAMSIFNVRIPGLPLTVVQADGLNLQPVETDEFQIGVAETFDVIVEPVEDAYTIVCESNDRSGQALATLARREGLQAAVPPLRPRPTLSMKDMGMAHGGGAEHAGHAAPAASAEASHAGHAASADSAHAQPESSGHAEHATQAAGAARAHADHADHADHGDHAAAADPAAPDGQSAAPAHAEHAAPAAGSSTGLEQ